MALRRHPALQDYSREHHDELLLVWKIREGLRTGISPQRIIDYCLHHYNELTSLHMRKEEEYILKKLPENDTEKIKILNEHSAIKDLVSQLSKPSADKSKLLSEFANVLEKHIRYEERIFFPKLQKDFNDDILASMEPGEGQIKECEVWKDPFWENKPGH